jgi:UDP-N-acetylmuramyl pentapeptide phosphotransferase/UDP-N-acetylglucosamine-1-phosphate transferase
MLYWEKTAAAIGAAFFVSWLGCLLVRWAMRRWQILDVPNLRSSHKLPTPSLGGLGIMAGFWTGAGSWLVVGGEIERNVFIGLGLGHLVLLVTVVDDLGCPLKVGQKMALELIAISAWLCFGPHLERVGLPWGGMLELDIWGWPLTVFWFIWLCNIYNFMDGIDGITASETLIVAGFMLVLLIGVGSGQWMLALLLIASTAGFLILNYPPASLFMGDVGSLFLGFTLGALGIVGQNEGVPFWIFIVLLGYYVYDSSYTIVRRALNGENVLQAHRKHLYQRLNILGWSHLQIDGGVWMVGLLLGGAGCAWVWGWPLVGWGLGLTGCVVLLWVTLWVEGRDKELK